MKPVIPVVLSLMLLVGFTADLAGQGAEPPQVGERVRIIGGPRPGEFTFVGQSADTLLLRENAGADTIRVPVSAIQHWDVRRPRSRGVEALRGGAAGLLFMGGTGALLGVLAGDDETCVELCLSAGQKALLAGGALGAVGLILGAFIGSMNPGDRWQRVAGATRLRVAPGAGGRLAISFLIVR